jgi:penicillin-binding protein 1A
MSIALGNLGLSPMKMAQLFSVFANKGHMIEPKIVSKIISRSGSVIYETRSKEIEGFSTPEQTYMMTDILHDVIKVGTGRNAQVSGIELAGKTGTTNKNVDAWFCGYSPTIEAIVWFGRDNNKPIGKSATGGAIAAPAFAYYYKHLLKLYPDTKRTFDIPQGVFRGDYDGRSELYTEISPLPNLKKKNNDPYMDDMMGNDVQDDDGYVIDNGYEDMSPEEDIRPEEDIGMAETINIDDDPNSEPEEGDPLHPNRKVPLVPVSNDSGTMF